MIKKGLALLLSMTLVAGAFVSCGSKDTNTNANSTTNDSDGKDKDDNNSGKKEDGENAVAQEIVWNLGSNPKTLDPGLNSASDGGDVINNLFEGLVREVDGQYVPGIAKSWQISEDGLEYIFNLRDSKWSDGSPLIAEDFVYSWKRAINPETKSEYAFIMYPILNASEYSSGEATADDVGIEAVDSSTLKVTLKSPAPYFLGLTQFYTYFPVNKKAVEAGEEGIWAKQPENFLGNGPFKLETFIDSDKIIMTKNENYWNADAIKLDKITALMIVEDSTAYTAYQNGEIQVVDSVPNELIPQLMIEDPEFYVIPMTGTYYYIFNMRDDAKEVFKNEKVRQALAYAIDRKTITDKVLKGGQIAATGFVPPGILDAEGNEFRTVNGNQGIEIDNSNVEKAKALLAEAGYPNGEGFPSFTLKYNTSESHKKVAEAVQAMWKDNLGIDVELSNAEWAVFQDDRSNGNFDVARGGWIGDYSDPNTMLDLFVKNGSHNDALWNNDEYTKLIEEASLLVGQERMNKFYEAEKILMKELPIFPVYYYSDFFMIKDNVLGVVKTNLNTFYFGNVTVEAPQE